MTSKSAKPKLLLVSGIPPWPTSSGGAVRALETLKYLSESFAIHFVSAIDPNQDVAALQKHVGPFCESFATFNVQPKKSLFSFFSRGVPYWLSEWYNPELALICKNLVDKHSIHLVQIETSQLLYLVPLLPENVFIICTAYDVQLVTFWRRLAETKNWLSKSFKLLLLLQIWHYERNLLPQLNLVAAVSTVDKRFLSQLYGLENTLTVPNGYQKPIELKNKPHSLFAIGFIGSAAHAPNQTAIEYLIKQLAPKLQAVIGAFELVFAGDTLGLDSKLFEQQKNVTITRLGYLENVADFYQNIDVLVAPLFSGSGTRIKILESLAHGVPVITTTVGAEGLEIDDVNESLLLAESPEEFVAQLVRIKNDPSFLAKKTFAISQTWQAIFRDYQAKLTQYTNKSQTPA
jgi:glycosyltransferase involved in cell wall biosynthesis